MISPLYFSFHDKNRDWEMSRNQTESETLYCIWVKSNALSGVKWQNKAITSVISYTFTTFKIKWL